MSKRPRDAACAADVTDQNEGRWIDEKKRNRNKCKTLELKKKRKLEKKGRTINV